MPFFDTHLHLDQLQQRLQLPLSELVANAVNADVQKMLIVAVQTCDFAKITAMVTRFPHQLYCALGLHPLYIQQHTKEDLTALEQQLDQGNSVMIGEIGLDRGITALLSKDLWTKQCEILEAQLSLAQKYHLPVNLHSRKSHEQLFSFLRQAQLSQGGVIHGFSGSYEQAKRFVDLGYKIGIGGTITYSRANKTRQAISRLPLSALVLETDSPYMPIFGFQGQPNRPERIKQIFSALCQIRAENDDFIQQSLWQNSLDFVAINLLRKS